MSLSNFHKNEDFSSERESLMMTLDRYETAKQLVFLEIACFQTAEFLGRPFAQLAVFLNEITEMNWFLHALLFQFGGVCLFCTANGGVGVSKLWRKMGMNFESSSFGTLETSKRTLGNDKAGDLARCGVFEVNFFICF